MTANPFGLVYDQALTENKAGQVTIETVHYQSNSIEIAANLYKPAGYSADKTYPAITVTHPNGGVKEQVTGYFAQKLAEAGYITIAADAAYQGASGGQPRIETIQPIVWKTFVRWQIILKQWQEWIRIELVPWVFVEVVVTPLKP